MQFLIVAILSPRIGNAFAADPPKLTPVVPPDACGKIRLILQLSLNCLEQFIKSDSRVPYCNCSGLSDDSCEKYVAAMRNGRIT